MDVGCPRPAIAGALILAVTGYAVAVAWLKTLPLYDCVVLVPLLAGAFAAMDRIDRADDGRAPRAGAGGAGPAGLRAGLLFTISALLCGAFLVRLWTLGYEGRNAVFGGILPWSDSADFQSDALRLVHGTRFSPASSRRPLFIAVLAALLDASGGEARVPIAVLTVLAAAAIPLPALEVWRTHGHRAALLVYVIFVFFERRWTGFIQTEHLGLPLGALGFALLWRASTGIRTAPCPYGQAVAVGVGVFSIALGLFARAGSFFVLPAVVAWGASLAPRPRRLPAAALYAGAILLAFGIHEAVLAATANGSSFSDYPPIFYGLLHGADFTAIAERYPWIGAVPTPDRIGAEWGIIRSELARSPWLLPLGLGRSLAAFFTSPFGLFSYVWTNPDDRIFEDGARMRALWHSGGVAAILGYWRDRLGTFSIVNTAAMGVLGAAFVIAFTVGALRILRRWRDLAARPARPDALLLASATGILASVPFMPPWITSGMQIQTATLGFAAAIAALAFGEPARAAAPHGVTPPRAAPFPGGSIAVLAAAIGAFAVGLAAVCLRPQRRPKADPSPLHWVHVDGSATVEVAATRRMSLRTKGIDDLRMSLEFLAKHNPDLVASLEPALRVGTLYHSAYDPARGGWEILVDEGRRLASRSGWVAVASAPLASPGVEQMLAVDAEPDVARARIPDAPRLR